MMKPCSGPRSPISQCICLRLHRMMMYEEHYADAEEGYDIDTSVDMIQNNFHNSTRQANSNQRRHPTPNNTRLPSDTRSQLSQDDRLV